MFTLRCAGIVAKLALPCGHRFTNTTTLLYFLIRYFWGKTEEMDSIVSRKALLKDLPMLEHFLQLLVDAERPFDETIDEGRIIYYDICELIKNNDAEVLVLEEEGRLVGCGYAQIKTAKPYLRHQQYAHLGFMFVIPEYRGKGLNQRLVADLKNWALSKGIQEVRLEVYAKNTSAIKAYEKAGFKELLTTMRYEIQES